AVGPARGLFLVNHIRFSSLFLICGSLTLLALLLALTIKYKKVEPETKMSQENKVVEKPRMQVVVKRALPASTLLFFISFTFGGFATFFPVYSFEQCFPSYAIHLYFVIYSVSLLSSLL